MTDNTIATAEETERHEQFAVIGLFEVNRDGVSARLPGVFSSWLRCSNFKGPDMSGLKNG